MAPRHFTLREANELLVAIRPLAERLVAHRKALAEVQASRDQVLGRIAGNGGGIDPRGVAELDERLTDELAGVARCVNGIHELGAIVKDPDTGLVDFPALRDGEEVLLCWQLGEDEIAYWHGVEEGYAGRKLLDAYN
jgi:hypothetical protein